MPRLLAGARIVYTPLLAAHFGAGTIGALPGIVRGTGGQAAAPAPRHGTRPATPRPPSTRSPPRAAGWA